MKHQNTARLIVLDRTGHTETALDLSTTDAITEAERLIAEHQQSGAAAFADGELLVKGQPLNPTVTEVLITPALQGG